MYAYLGKDGLYMDRNLNLILIKMEMDREVVEDLMVVSKDSDVFTKLDIDKEFILISPKYHTCINSDMDLIKITPDDMDCTFVEYVKKNTDTHTQHLVLTMVGRMVRVRTEFTDTIASQSPLPKQNTKKSKEVKDTINSITNIFMMDIVDLLYAVGPDSDIALSNYLNTNNVKTFLVRQHIKDYLNLFGFYVFHDALLEHLVIIKNLDKSFNCKTNRPLTIYSDVKDLGLMIGTKGANVNKLKDTLNTLNTNWVVPYITVKNILERPTNTDIDAAVKTYLRLITNMLKIRFMLGVKND